MRKEHHLALPRLSRESVLKPETVAKLFPSKHRTRATAISIDDVVVEPYVPAIHGLDFLLRLWAILAQSGELSRLLGPWAQSPTSFAQIMGTNADMLVLHHDGARWPTGEGLVAVAYLDDTEGICRTRVHHFVMTKYRHPRVTQGLGQMVIDYLFSVRGFHLLWGLTAVKNRGALRFSRHLGFEPVHIWENAVLWEQLPTDAMQTMLTRARWQARKEAYP